MIAFRLVLTAVALIGLGLPAVASSRHPAAKAADAKPTTPEKAFPLGNTWILQSINGKVPVGEAPSFALDTTMRATGFSGCNTFSMALYPVKDQKLAAGAIALTRKTCDKATMLAERDFLVGLHSLPTWQASDNGDLTIKGRTGVMQFRRGI
ncbi:META domain-containing protein [Lichenihabitans psoromatis]|uniref:META domain-containing protein n=1 Tax=Lichenihabitans psoromatis TaxID=2528642 RepID=UPI0010385B57|nr:META domain-containing protein [Lichenihabitans psoromatis]